MTIASNVTEKLTREQIKKIRFHYSVMSDTTSLEVVLVCDAALDAQKRIEELEEATSRHARDLEAIKLFVKNLYDDAPSAPYDNGGTSDGWQRACNRIEAYIEGVQQARALNTPKEAGE